VSEIILVFTIWLVSGDKLTEQHEKPFASTMECTLAGQIEALKKVKEYEAQGKEATVHFTCAPKVDERQCERLDSPPFTAGIHRSSTLNVIARALKQSNLAISTG